MQTIELNRLAKLPTEVAFCVAQQSDSLKDATAFLQAHSGAMSTSSLHVLKHAKLWSRSFACAKQNAPVLQYTSPHERAAQRANAKTAAESIGLALGIVGQLPVWLGVVVGQYTWAPAQAAVALPTGAALLKTQLFGFGMLVGLIPLGFELGRLVAPALLRQVARSAGQYAAATAILEEAHDFLPSQQRHRLQYRAAVAGVSAAAMLGTCAATMALGLTCHVGWQLGGALIGASTTKTALVVLVDAIVFGTAAYVAIRYLQNAGMQGPDARRSGPADHHGQQTANMFAILKRDGAREYVESYHQCLGDVQALMTEAGFN